MKLLQVAIADDHPVVLAALKTVLCKVPDLRVEVEVSSGDGLLALLRQHACNIVITDFSMPNDENEDSDGFTLIKRIKSDFSSSKIIVYTAMSNTAVIRRLYRMGVFSVINKREKTDELINACVAARTGKQAYFPLSLRGELEMSWAQGEAFSSSKELTVSEMEVVRYFVEGNSLTDICDRLSRTPSTVSTHKNNAMRKLGLSSDADLIKYAYTSGLI
ncbi:response regulator transcription factor [Herbaspirillum sp. RTI4]|uniref:response regulator transcription factor n=1 Tax=Herbaspirillum sp. RTI4 TaxID=3048640 RepID=UPI002AB39BE7|nr:response regulator transcription factor [Herbaspirillum sp. RTI4]MDY7579810.1 response regulator transcription factor [Herbaspirillum sp. RTI4]MEA9982585.1 response regulator transcription factor [Herbaspirillum sp. RTI4]